jgi:hypothetical protein
MPRRRTQVGPASLVRLAVSAGLWFALLIPCLVPAVDARGAATVPTTAGGDPAAICDPPGPAPRFGCTWSLDLCDWICPICDPFGSPPRSSCSWDLTLCNWNCPGYTGVKVDVSVLQAPDSQSTVYLRLSSLCTATGASATCQGSFAVHPGTSPAAKCRAIADAITAGCQSAGYAVTGDACADSASLTAANVGCPATPFALGLSNDPSVFDQSEQAPMADGEIDSIVGSTAACALTPGPVTNLALSVTLDGDLHLTWDDVPDADDYIVFSDTMANGTFSTVVGTAASGTGGLTIGMPAESEMYLVAGRNAVCGQGPEH